MHTPRDVPGLLWTQPSVGHFHGPPPIPLVLLSPMHYRSPGYSANTTGCKYTSVQIHLGANTPFSESQFKCSSQHNFGQLSQTQWSSRRTTLARKYCSYRLTNKARSVIQYSQGIQQPVGLNSNRADIDREWNPRWLSDRHPAVTIVHPRSDYV